MSPDLRRRAPPGSAWKGAVVLAAVCVALAGIASSDTLHNLILRALGGAEGLIAAHPRWGIFLFVLFSSVSAMVAFFSTAVIVPVAIHTWGAGSTIALLWAGWMIGGMLAYSIGRFLGRPVVNRLTNGAALVRFENRITARAPFSLVLLFQLALPSEVPGYLLGLVRYRFWKYLLVLGIGELPYAVGTVYLGESFVRRRTSMLLALGVGGGLFIAWAFHLLQKRLSPRP